MGTLNRAERALVGNPARDAVLRHVEARFLRWLGGRLDGATVLEVGCGTGAGATAIVDRFGAARVVATDVDPRMIEAARRRLADRPGIEVKVADACALPFDDASFDAAFDHAALHHVPRWRDALAELHRVVRPGGLVFVEEYYPASTHNLVARVLFDHPRHDRFDHRALLAGLVAAGFRIERERVAVRHIGWVVARRDNGGR